MSLYRSDTNLAGICTSLPSVTITPVYNTQHDEDISPSNAKITTSWSLSCETSRSGVNITESLSAVGRKSDQEEPVDLSLNLMNNDCRRPRRRPVDSTQTGLPSCVPVRSSGLPVDLRVSPVSPSSRPVDGRSTAVMNALRLSTRRTT